MKIGLPEGQPKPNNQNNKKSKSKKIIKKSKKIDSKNINWWDNSDTISTKIGSQLIYIDKKSFDIQLRNGFIIKCSSIEDAKSKAILLFNN